MFFSYTKEFPSSSANIGVWHTLRSVIIFIHKFYTTSHLLQLSFTKCTQLCLERRTPPHGSAHSQFFSFVNWCSSFNSYSDQLPTDHSSQRTKMNNFQHNDAIQGPNNILSLTYVMGKWYRPQVNNSSMRTCQQLNRVFGTAKVPIHNMDSNTCPIPSLVLESEGVEG